MIAPGFPVRAKKVGRHVAVFTARAPATKDGEAQLRALRDALAPEADGALPGAAIAVRARGGAVEIRIEADSVRALRAAVNSYLRAAALAADVAGAARAN